MPATLLADNLRLMPFLTDYIGNHAFAVKTGYNDLAGTGFGKFNGNIADILKAHVRTVVR